jgi:hypothetical protein
VLVLCYGVGVVCCVLVLVLCYGAGAVCCVLVLWVLVD